MQQPPNPYPQYPQFQQPSQQQWQQQPDYTQPQTYSQQPYNAPTSPYAPPPPYNYNTPSNRPSGFRHWFRTRSRKTKIGLGCGTLIAALLLCICAASAYGSSTVATTLTPTPTTGHAAIINSSTDTPTLPPTPTQKPTQAPKLTIDQQINQIVQNAGMSGKNIKSLYNVAGDNYEQVQEDIGDGNLTNALTVWEIHMDCFNVQKALWTQEKSHLSEVEVVVNMNVVDQYGNESNETVGSCDLKSATEQLFNWSNLDHESAWQDYDDTFIAPFLLK